MRALQPEFVKVDPITVMTITSVGDPNHSEKYFKALYGTAYGTKFKVFKPQGRNMSLGKLMARWPDAHLKPKSKWTGIWGLPVPDFVTTHDLVQKDPTLPVSVEVWRYGEVAQILHKGPYTSEGPTVAILHKFIKDNGYEIDGNSHEEIYLTPPNVKDQKTIIRYKVKKSVK